MTAGGFCLLDIRRLGMTGAEYAALLRHRHRVLVVPVSSFPSAQDMTGDTRVRIALSRPYRTIAGLAAVLNDSVAALATRP